MSNTADNLREIKQSFRLRMNGVASQSMREKGSDYHLNWGVSLVDLREMAAKYGKDYDLAVALWKENIRECKILATMLMPAERMSMELSHKWMSEINTQELSELTAYNLFQHTLFAKEISMEWLCQPNPFSQITACMVLSRLFMQGRVLTDDEIEEWCLQISKALNNSHAGVRHAAAVCLQRFSEINDACAKTVSKHFPDFLL